MSINEDVFREQLETRLAGLSRAQKYHSLIRLMEILRRIHNDVSAATEMRKVMTVAEFQVLRPVVYAKIAPELTPYVSGGYLERLGWGIFKSSMFEPRQMAVIVFLGELKVELKGIVADQEINPFE